MTQSAGRYSPLGLASLALDHAKLLVLVPLAALVLSTGFTLVLDGKYAARASFAPQSRQAETARLAGLASQFGVNLGGLAGGDAESVDFYARLVHSRGLLEQVALTEYRFARRTGSADTLSGNLIDLLGIDERTRGEELLAAVGALEEMIEVGLDLNANVVLLTTRTPWAGLSEQINRAVLDGIHRFNLERRQSQAAAERRFLEQQIARAQQDLKQAEDELSAFMERNRRYEDWPQLRFEAGRLQRGVDVRQQVYTTLAQRLEQARVDEVRNTPVITIIDAPEGSATNEASLLRNGVLSIILGIGLVIGFLFMREYGMQLRTQHPDDYARLQARSQQLLPRRRRRDVRSALLPLLLPVSLLGLTGCDDTFAGPEAPAVFTAVSTGGNHSCAVTESGAVYCWGRGQDGELGHGQATASQRPVRVASEIPFVDVAAGENHTCALAEDGSAWCWGWNVFIQRGNAVDERHAAPVPVVGNLRYVSLASGAHHSCGVTVDGLAYCWGYNAYGQIGDGTFGRTWGPTSVAGELRFQSITAGDAHTCAIAVDGRAYCWGRNDLGQLGIGSSEALVPLPTPVAGGRTFTQLSAGADHTCGLSGGRAFCWGSAESGQMGDGSASRENLPGPNSPAPSATAFTFQRISAGSHVTCGVTTGNLGLCWGRGEYGQLGTGAWHDNYHPQTVERHAEGSLRFRRIEAGGNTHVCGISTGDALYCWGTGHEGQLGHGGETLANVPVRVQGTPGAIQ